MNYDKLVYVYQGFLTDIYIDKETWKPVTLARKLRINDTEVKGNIRKECLRLFRIFKRIPKNFEKLPIIGQEDFEKVYHRSKSEQYDALVEFLINEGESETIRIVSPMKVSYISHMTMTEKYSDIFGSFVGSALPKKVICELEKVMNNSNQDDVLYLLKKMCNKYSKEIKKYGMVKFTPGFSAEHK